MKTKLLTISRLVKLFAIVALALVHTSCDETETTDSSLLWRDGHRPFYDVHIGSTDL